MPVNVFHSRRCRYGVRARRPCSMVSGALCPSGWATPCSMSAPRAARAVTQYTTTAHRHSRDWEDDMEDDMEDVAEVALSGPGATVYEEGWQSWSPTGSF